MTHLKGAIWTERLLLALILISLAATLNLLLAIHRQAPADKHASTAEVAAPTIAESHERSPEPLSEPAAPEGPVIAEKTEPQPAPPPPEDPTKKAIASLATATEKETKAAEEADRRASALEQAYRSAAAESDRWKRREMLVRQQIAGITVEAEKLERKADELDAERDVLEREVDATKAALAKATARSGFAVLPYKGPNGTWRRPIVVECTGGGAMLQPRGPRFTSPELSPRINPRSSEFVRAIARELLHIRSADTPDGTPAVPYIVFLVRPDGIGAYYLARTSLEPLGIAFGYELVEQKLAVNIPDFDDLTTWDGTMPLDMPLEPAPGSLSSPKRLASGDQDQSANRNELAGRARSDQGSMIGSLAGPGPRSREVNESGSGSGAAGPEDFVWPGRGRGAARDGEQASSPIAAAERESQGAPGRTSSPSGERGAGGNGLVGGAAGLYPSPGDQLAKGENLSSSGAPGSSDAASGPGFPSGERGAGDNGLPGGAAGLYPSLGNQLAKAETLGSTGAPVGGEKAGSGTGADKNAGRFPAATAGGQGSGSRPVGFGSGMTGNAVNAEDIGASPGEGGGVDSGAGAGAGASAGGGAGAQSGGTLAQPGAQAAGTLTAAGAGEQAGPSGGDPADRPFSVGGAGSGGPVGGQRAPGARFGGTDGLIPLPTFEPAADQASGDSPSSGPAGLQATGRSAGGGPQRSQASFSGQAGDQAATTGPAQAGVKSSTAATPDRTGGRGQAQGFDWNQAAQDKSPASGADALDSDPGAGALPPSDETTAQGTPPPPQNLAPGRAISRSSLPAGGQPGAQAGAYQSGTYSQEDVDRAKALSGLSSLVNPGLAQQLVGATSASGSASGTPSSASSSQSDSSSQSGGMPLGGMTQSSPSSSASSNPSFGQFTLPNSSSSSDDAKELTIPPRKKESAPLGAIDSRFEIVVVCRKNEVLLHPGAYRLTDDVLRSRGQETDPMLAREIRAMVRNRAIVDPLIHQKPAIRFLVESQGAETFAIARRQLLFSLPDWPVSLQVAGSHDAGVFSRNRW